jgi:hypothetical protein
MKMRAVVSVEHGKPLVIEEGQPDPTPWPVQYRGRAIVELWARHRYSKAGERSPAPGRTPGSGSSPKRRVMSLMMDVVS